MELLSSAPHALSIAADALRKGLLVAIPTETVYGLAADAFNTMALARVFEAKRRPHFDPLIIHISALSMLDRILDRDSLGAGGQDRLARLATAFWPGPLTLILPKLPRVPDLATSGLPSVAVRWPAHPVPQALIASCGPLAAPSANPFGYLSPTRASHVAEQLGERVDYIVDGGPCEFGVESTVLDITGETPCILRPGGLPRQAIEDCVGPVSLLDRSVAHPTAPGQLKSHYAPHAPLSLFERGQLDPSLARPGDVLVFFSRADAERAMAGCSLPMTGSIRVLSEQGDQKEAARSLFDLLHELDSASVRSILAEKLPSGGLGDAVNDRLSKARSQNRI